MDGFRLHFRVTNTKIYVGLSVWYGWEKGKVKGHCPGFYIEIKFKEENNSSILDIVFLIDILDFKEYHINKLAKTILRSCGTFLPFL
jgi:hypothetical protein